MSKEIEIKLPLENPETVEKFLDSVAKLVYKNHIQKDTYYIPKHRNFLEVKYPYEWFRLRESKKSSVTYKHYYPENAEKNEYCDEFETEIADPAALKQILLSLDFKQIIVVHKARSAWMLDDVEIAIDFVKKLGHFIELELKKEMLPKEGLDYLRQTLNKLNAEVGKEDLRGYPFLVLEKEK